MCQTQRPISSTKARANAQLELSPQTFAAVDDVQLDRAWIDAAIDRQNSVTYLRDVLTAISPRGKLLATGRTGDRRVKIWDRESSARLAVLHAPADYVEAIAFAPDGRTLAILDETGLVTLWDMGTYRESGRLQAHQSARPMTLVYSRDGHWLASSGDEGIVRVWDAEARRPAFVLQGDPQDINGIDFSPNGSMLATGGANRVITLWSLTTGKVLATLAGHSGRVTCVAFSPDGRSLASGSDDKTVKLWDVATEQELFTLRNCAIGVRTVAFSANGQQLVAGAWNADYQGDIHVWSAERPSPPREPERVQVDSQAQAMHSLPQTDRND